MGRGGRGKPAPFPESLGHVTAAAAAADADPVPAACYLWWPGAAGKGRCRRAVPGSSRLLQRSPSLNRKQIALDESYAGMFLSRAGPELWKTRCHSAEPRGNPLYSPLPLLLARVATGSCRYLVRDVPAPRLGLRFPRSSGEAVVGSVLGKPRLQKCLGLSQFTRDVFLRGPGCACGCGAQAPLGVCVRPKSLRVSGQSGSHSPAGCLWGAPSMLGFWGLVQLGCAGPAQTHRQAPAPEPGCGFAAFRGAAVAHRQRGFPLLQRGERL